MGWALGLLLGNFFWGLVALAARGRAPLDGAHGGLAKRRTAAFTAQLPDMLQLLGTTLRSGFSILQGLGHGPAADAGPHRQGDAPRGGRGPPGALAHRSPSPRWPSGCAAMTSSGWSSAIGIQREVGGNLAELLDIVADTMLARARIRREAHTLTAEGRIGAVVISVLPIAIGLFVYAVNPSYISPLLHQAFGEILFYGSIVLALIGILWVRKLVNIEV